MIKSVFTMFVSLAIGIVGTLYTTNWQEEKLVFELGEIAKFGDLTYQNIRVRNEGWNPATNVVIQLNANYITQENIKASPKFEVAANDNRIGGYERIRRNEVATLSFVFKGEPITASMFTIKSDRSIAIYKDPTEEGHKIDWSFVSFMVMMVTFAVGLFSAIAIPAYQEYVRRAKAIQDKKTGEDLI